MAKKRLLQVTAFLLFLSSSCAWASNGGATSEASAEKAVLRRLGEEVSENPPIWWRLTGKAVEAVEERLEGLVARIQPDGPSPAELAERANITPPPSMELLRKRQDDGQIQALSAQIRSISDASRQVSQASQQVSQSSQQLSQSLQQAQQQLSQTQQQLASARAQADSSRQSAEAANQDRDKANRDADAARQSASSAISSAQSSASNALAENMAAATSSAGASAASVIAAASESASVIMASAASMVQQARADATAVRAEADTKVLQAQGTAVSVTQAAVAVVGATVLSSLLTIGAFVLVLRYKRNRKRRRTLRAAAAGEGISYPALNGASNGYEPGGYESNAGFPADIKEPPPAATANRNSEDNGRIGFATSGYDATISNRNRSDSNSNDKDFHLRTPPKGKFTLFPKSREERERQADAGRSFSPDGGDSESNYSSTSREDRAPSRQDERASRVLPPSLDTWLRAGTVSPFGTLNKNNDAAQPQPAKRGPNWPLSRQG